MRRLLRARRQLMLLLAAGAVGLGHSAQAQSFPEVTSAALVKPSSGQAQLERMKVELAWLADLTCFSHPLEARATGSSLEVCGIVPDERTREHVMRVARHNCFLPVVDALTVSTSSAGPRPGSPVQLRHAAAKHLVRTFGQRAAGFDVQASADGKIIINGSVSCVEDKVSISRCLREVPGCGCVLNQLSVMPTTHAGQTVTLVSADRKHMVRGALPPATTPSSIPIVSSSPPPLEEGEIHLPRVARAPTPYAVSSAPVMTLPSGLPPTRPTQVSPSYWSQGSMGAVTPQAPPTPSWASPSAGGCPTCMACAAPPAEKSGLFPFLSRLGASRFANPPTANPSGMVLSPYATPATPGVTYYQPSGNAFASAQPAMQSRSGPIMQVSAMAPASPTPNDTVSAMRLQQFVYNACGGLARKVEISMQRDRSLHVQVHAANSAVERQLVERLMQIPEMTSPGVRLEVMVMP